MCAAGRSGGYAARPRNGEEYLKGGDELAPFFAPQSWEPAALAATGEIAARCDLSLLKGGILRALRILAQGLGGLGRGPLGHAAEHDVVEADDTDFGTSYTVDGALRAPDGRMPLVSVIWFIETGEMAPRLVTAYLLKGAKT